MKTFLIAIPALLVSSALAQSSATPAAGSPAAASSSTVTTPSASAPTDEAAMMKQMMELAQPGENQKLLASLVGNWTTNTKMWMAPDAPPTQSTGSATRKALMGGRYFTVDFNGTIKMPGADGKLKDMSFMGNSLEAYDNVKKKFLATWIDSMSTGIFIAEGDYDPPTQTFTYTGEYEMVPGAKIKVRQRVKIVDADHNVFEYYENRGGQDVKTMEISYTRTK